MSSVNNIRPTAASVLERLTLFANNNKRPLDTLVKQYMQERFLYKLSLLPSCQRKLVLQEYTLEEIKGAYLGDSSDRFFRNLNFVWQAGPSARFIVIRKPPVRLGVQSRLNRSTRQKNSFCIMK